MQSSTATSNIVVCMVGIWNTQATHAYVKALTSRHAKEQQEGNGPIDERAAEVKVDFTLDIRNFAYPCIYVNVAFNCKCGEFWGLVGL